MMFLDELDVIEWVSSYNTTGAPLKESEIADFVKQLHEKVLQMNFSVKCGCEKYRREFSNCRTTS